MPIIVHFGNPRQGKSYAAVADRILPALGAGRRVVTNVEGMGDPARRELMQQAVQKRYGRSEPIDFDFVPHSQLEQAVIFPVDTKTEDADGTRIFDDSQSVVKFGTLIVWDEARMFSTGELPKYWHDALTYHGHWARGGSTVDIVLIHQNWKGLAPLVRATAELVYEFVKKSNGKGYTRFTYSSPGDRELSRTSKQTLSESFSYDKDVFALYKTNSDDAATNDNVAVSFWKTSYFRGKIKFVILALILGIASLAYTVPKFIPDGVGEQASQTAVGPAMANLAPGDGAVDVGLPVIVGKVPSGPGVVAIVKDGDDFITVTPKDGIVTYRGRVLKWPLDF